MADESEIRQQETPKPRFMIEYDPTTNATPFKLQGAFPLGLLVNALEVAKAFYVAHQLGSMQIKPGIVPARGALDGGLGRR